MKRSFTLFLFSLLLLTVSSQNKYKVSIDESKKNILLEEFTGIHCSFCPDGHRIAKELQNGFGDRLIVVNLHAGPFSPKKDECNLTTDDGDSLAYKFHPTSYPCAMINRHAFSSGNYLNQRDGWLPLTKRLKDEVAPLNLYLESSYDDSTRMLNIHVEGYAVHDNSYDDMRLNVLLTQDYIDGKQFGVPDPLNYTHMKVMRDYVTSFEGEKISSMKKGSYFTADYAYSLPKNINNQQVIAGNINVVAFVTTNGMTEIANAASCKPEYLNINDSADAELLYPDMPVGEKYGYKYFEGKIRNKYSKRITSATFVVDINGEEHEIVTDCDILPFETSDVSVPFDYKYDDQGNVNYRITMTAVNGCNVKPSCLEGRFIRPSFSGQNVKIVILTDRNADEDRYLLKDDNGNLIREFGPYPEKKSAQYEESLVLDDGKTYCLEILDIFGNGITSGKKGMVTVSSDDESEIEKVSPILKFGTRIFFTVDKSLAIDNVPVSITNEGRCYSIDGIQDNGTLRSIVIKNGKKYLRTR